ncbi:hypothetical protein ACX27_22735 [Nostoc piscinale CENA21]|uniref:Lipoprotein n=1 Tax=Nostoc piscinale CENA21 TaxID=224013 RepID=A0A0M4SU54_9NOSO|nr:hypothetical protein [Nostoc piscinale]ALF55002.1 hypothetical protein ACX27_22735 [Nostoc piscinale CENA21]
MGRKSKIAIATILTLAIAGCASESTPQASTPAPTPEAPGTPAPPVPPAVAPPAKAPPVTQAVQSFNNPVVSTKKVTNVAFTPPTLIQPTDGKTRIDLVTKGRPDPFAQIVTPSSAEVGKNPNAKQIPRLPPLSVAIVKNRKVPINSASTKKTSIALAGTTTILPKVLPQVVPSNPFGSVLPSTPQPDLAKAVVVTGVVLIGREPQAIIQIPNEPSSRYVQAGQRLANGLLIKRIEMNQGSNPIVILEQYGIEVARMVGEAPTNSTPSVTSAAHGNAISSTLPTQNLNAVGAS